MNLTLRWLPNSLAGGAHRAIPRSLQKRCSILLLCGLVGACAVNPVTGEKELGLISAAQEIAIGEQQYAPSQQSQGGPYYLDQQLNTYVSSVGNALAGYSARSQLPYEFVVLNSSIPNAWALPGGKIAVNRGLLLQLEDESELAAVLAHEIVHAAARHGAQQMEQGMLLGTGLQVLGATVGDSMYRDAILQGAGLGAALIQTRYGRSAELEADAYGMRYMAAAGYDPAGAVSLQETFVKLAGERRPDWLAGLFSSHPPSAERVAANRATAAKLAAGGDRGRTRYQRATASLRRHQAAYQHHDKGMGLLAQKQYQAALAEAERALKLSDQEGLFHELRGLALQGLGREQEALRAFNNAVARNDGYFRHHLLRGLLAKRKGRMQVAEQSLLQANSLLPTAQASFALAEISEQRGDAARAADYYREVAASKSPLAGTARERLYRLTGTGA